VTLGSQWHRVLTTATRCHHTAPMFAMSKMRRVQYSYYTFNTAAAVLSSLHNLQTFCHNAYSISNRLTMHQLNTNSLAMRISK